MSGARRHTHIQMATRKLRCKHTQTHFDHTFGARTTTIERKACTKLIRRAAVEAKKKKNKCRLNYGWQKQDATR